MDEIIEQHIYNRFLFLSMFKKGKTPFFFSTFNV